MRGNGGVLIMPPMNRPILFLVSCFLFLSSCASPEKSEITYYHPQTGQETPASLMDRVTELEKGNFENVRFETLAENAFSSHHLVIIKKEEALHYHERHDLWVLVLKGKGELVLREKSFDLYPGATFFIPQGMWHAAKRKGVEPLAALVISTPPYDRGDNVQVEV